MTERRISGVRPLIDGAPALPISLLNLRGWKWSERYGDARRAGALEYRQPRGITGMVTYEATIGRESGVLLLTCNFSDEPHPTLEYVEILSIPNAWGGRHWFFVCPLTGRRARKLHRWPGLGFAHREASPIPPVYRCQRDSGQARTARAMADIRRRLGGVSGHFEKPTGMPMKTYIRLATRYMALHDRFWAPTREMVGRQP